MTNANASRHLHPHAALTPDPKWLAAYRLGAFVEKQPMYAGLFTERPEDEWHTAGGILLVMEEAAGAVVTLQDEIPVNTYRELRKLLDEVIDHWRAIFEAVWESRHSEAATLQFPNPPSPCKGYRPDLGELTIHALPATSAYRPLFDLGRVLAFLQNQQCRWEEPRFVTDLTPLVSAVQVLPAGIIGQVPDLRAIHDNATRLPQLGTRAFLQEILDERASKLKRYGPDWDCFATQSLLGKLDKALQEALADVPVLLPSSQPAAHSSGPPSANPCFKLDGNVWHVRFDGKEGRFSDTVGMQYIRRLLMQPNKSIRAADLAGVNEKLKARYPHAERCGGGKPEALPAGESRQEILDPKAKDDFRNRLAEVKAELEEAREYNDLGRIEPLQLEEQQIIDELKRKLDLRGRSRRLGPAGKDEKARTAVWQALHRAYKCLVDASPSMKPLVEHLRASIRTERTSYIYRPDGEVPDWEL
jgi:hypothetical protein